MSYRKDTNATYDRNLLSSVPDPTRAERQEGYNVDLLDEGRDHRAPSPPAPVPVPNRLPTDQQPLTDSYSPGSVALAHKEGQTEKGTGYGTKGGPWYRTRWGLMAIIIAIVLIIGAIVGGVVGGTHHSSHKNSSLSGNGTSSGNPSSSTLSGGGGGGGSGGVGGGPTSTGSTNSSTTPGVGINSATSTSAVPGFGTESPTTNLTSTTSTPTNRNPVPGPASQEPPSQGSPTP